MKSAADHSKIVKQLAHDNGFMYCGISKVQKLDKEASRLENWLNTNNHGEMQYLANHFDKRINPELLLPGAKSIITFLYNYFPDKVQINDTYKIAKYAYGEDYHDVLKDKIHVLFSQLKSQLGDIEGRVFVDSAPVMERVWAEKSGVGWIGKNGLLINKKSGSFYFIGELIIDLECEPDGPIKDYCGSCTACIDSCPTDAILPNKTLVANKCISYLTIELKNEIPDEYHGKLNEWIFGCDICQDVCPWNRFSEPHLEKLFNPKEEILTMDKKEWNDLNEEMFDRLFKNSAIKRTKFNGLKRNIKANGI